MTKGRSLPGLTAGITLAALAIVVLAVDQLSKQWVLGNLVEGERVSVLGDALQWQLVFNPGAAFSIGEGSTWIFTLALAAVAIAIIVLAILRVRSWPWAIVLGLLLGGVLGNLTDRLLREPGFLVGHVVDFILTPWMWFYLPGPAIFNVADMFIVCDMIAVAVLVLIGVGFDGRRVETKRVAADTPDERP
ncbi:signal peptidase II [Microbacterium indicum]|uniref:signal peptidase II n=1 Tax=Microbacterium indicum TaxID=358100 RepID=UPI000404DF42|nr:signal peptidase II [Microbacterium indicum]